LKFGILEGEAMTGAYVHGYDPRENLRLQDQASTLVQLLHSDTAYPAGSSVLEAGCGVGAQTITLAANSPPRMVYVDSSKPDLVEGFTKNTFTAMTEGIRKPSLESGMMSETDFDKGIADLYRTAEADGVFCYTFFKASAVNDSQTELPSRQMTNSK
jgi:hypothetical protein